jgi:hypothetical protein
MRRDFSAFSPGMARKAGCAADLPWLGQGTYIDAYGCEKTA